MGWYVYLVSCSDGSLYTGITRDPREREAAHNSGTGSAYTRSRRPVRLSYVEPADGKPAALRRELQLKGLSRQGKLELLATRSQVSCDAPLLTLPGFQPPHGFSTRVGGVSEGPYASLNLGAGVSDDPVRVAENRRAFREWFGVQEGELCLLEQVHGDRVVIAGEEESPQADAQISDDPSKLLVIGAADCLPLLFFDRVSGAVGAAHCGWRGTLAELASKTIAAMSDRFGSEPSQLLVALGPGICGDCYEVGADLVQRFLEAGFPPEIAERDEQGRWHLDLAAANLDVLRRAGIAEEAVLVAGDAGQRTKGSRPACTSCGPGLFYSHRRDRGITGRHWAAVRATGRNVTA